MLLVVPVEEPAAEVEAVVEGGEPVREVGAVLEGLELTLGEGVVVADVGSAVRLGHAKGGQQLGHGLGSHGWAAVAVDRELIAVDAFLHERLADQSFGQVLWKTSGTHTAAIGRSDRRDSQQEGGSLRPDQTGSW